MYSQRRRAAAKLGVLLIGVFIFSLPGYRAEATHTTFAPGDVIVTLSTGQVQWRHPDGTLNRILVGTVAGPAEGIAFDATGNLYITHWCADPTCTTGNTVERFNTGGLSTGTVGSGYNCNPHAIVFAPTGSAYVGQADCTGAILRFDLGKPPVAYTAAAENRGSAWIDLAPDGCTIFYTSWGPNVKRFNVCINTQLANFNIAPLPDFQGYELRILPDGGVLVASTTIIVRLDASGNQVQTYDVPGEPRLWAGLDLVGDGTFWVSNYGSSNAYKFDIATGAVRASFNAGTPSFTVNDIGVKRP